MSLWIASGANVKAVAGRAGHAGVAFTLDRYGHLMDDHDAELVDALDVVGRAAQPDGNVVSLAARSR